jgi:hypothetical protein
VLSAVFGEAAGGEDVYRDEERFALVNSTRRYGPTGTLRVRVADGSKSVDGARVVVSLWNFGALRGIARITTGEDGFAELTLGDGDYVVSVGEPGGHDWTVARVREGGTSEVSLDTRKSRPFGASFRMVHAPGEESAE